MACEEAGLAEAAESWRTTTILFVVLLVLPLGAFHVLALAAMLMGKSFRFDLGPAGLFLLVVFAVPIVHVFVSTSRMARAAEAASLAGAYAPDES